MISALKQVDKEPVPLVQVAIESTISRMEDAMRSSVVELANKDVPKLHEGRWAAPFSIPFSAVVLKGDRAGVGNA